MTYSGTPVKITHAHKYYNRGKSNQIHVMDDVSLELPESGMIAIFGESGCGKTTLLNAVGGLDKIASGSIELFGTDIREDTDTLRNRYVGYIFQNYNLNVRETVYENVAAALRLCGLEDETDISERVMAALSNVDMAKYRDRTPDTLSGGQQQRVAIARALVKNPAIILADEPTGNLDENNTVLVMDILKEISRTHLVLLVTHEADLVDYYCDRVIEIVDGRIAGERVNEGANGYIQRNKNDIYLGELTRTDSTAGGVSLSYYSDTDTPRELSLRVVNVGGKLYLKCDDPSVKLLDEGAEVQLKEGVFEAAPTAERGSNGRQLDMSRLTPVEGKSFGRLYHWKNAVTSAWRENFTRKKRVGQGLLRACLILLAVVMVFMTAAMGSGVGSYVELSQKTDEGSFFIPLDPDKDYAFIREEMGKHGMDFARIVSSSVSYTGEDLEFTSSYFMTADRISLSTDMARSVSVEHAADLPLVAGTRELSREGDILITTAVADELLENSTISYMNEYVDLVGLVTSNASWNSWSTELRIVGVVESESLFYYANPLEQAAATLRNFFWVPVTYYSSTVIEDPLAPGEMIFIRNSAAMGDHGVGDTVTVLGKSFTVVRVIDSYMSIEQLPAYMKETYGVTVKDMDTYVRDRMAEDGTMDATRAEAEWLLEHYIPHYTTFVKDMITYRHRYEHIDFGEWAAAVKGNLAATVSYLSLDAARAVLFSLYHADHGVYPTEAELTAYAEEPAVMDRVNAQLDLRQANYEYDRYMDDRFSNNYGKYSYCYVIQDSDYISLATGAGKTDDRVGGSTYHKFEEWDGSTYYSNHLMVQSSDPDATAAFLSERLGDDVLTPRQVFVMNLQNIRQGVLVAVISILAVLVLMCLCVYFIMRSSFMSRIREVGILRAIGVTKRNLVFRFAVETGLLIALTLLVGYLASAWFVISLSGAPLFSTIFYFPVWLAALLLGVIALAALFFGVLPAMVLLRRTPSEILSKYDI